MAVDKESIPAVASAFDLTLEAVLARSSVSREILDLDKYQMKSCI